MRGLLVLTLLCALSLAVPWWLHVRPFRLEQRALTDLQPFLSREVNTEALGPAYLEKIYDKECRQRVVKLYLSGDDMRDTDLAKIRQFSHLEILMIENCPRISESGLVRGIHGATVQNLALTNVPITCKVLREVQQLPNLQMLQIVSDHVTDEDLTELNGLNGLNVLWLYAPNVTDQGLAHLESLTGLNRLVLDCPRVTDKGLARLKRLTSLISLVLKCPCVTDDGLVHLKHLVQLEGLALECSVTDAGMPHLATLKNLQKLRCKNPSAGSSDPDALSDDTRCKVIDMPLIDVAAHLSKQHSIDIRFDEQTLSDAGVEAGQIRVTLDERRVTLDECLQTLLQPHGLNYLVERDALVITTQDVAPRREREIDKLSKTLTKLKRFDVNW
jgi:hypothetical protein